MRQGGVVDPRDRQRLAVAHRILDAIRSKSFRSETLATRAGEHVIVPALPDDAMATLFDQLRDTGGPLHVAVLSDGNLIVFAMTRLRTARHAGPQGDAVDNDFPVSPHMSVGIVLDYLLLRGKPMIFHEETPQVSIELVENPQDEPAPNGSHAAPRRVNAGCQDR